MQSKPNPSQLNNPNPKKQFQNYHIEFNCYSFKAFYHIISSFTKLCPPTINISLMKNRLFFTTNLNTHQSSNNILLYIINLDTSLKVKISKEPQSQVKVFTVTCLLKTLQPIMQTLFKFPKLSPTVIWTILSTNNCKEWRMIFKSTDLGLKFEVDVNQSDSTIFSIPDSLDNGFLVKLSYDYFLKYLTKDADVLWFNGKMLKTINDDLLESLGGLFINLDKMKNESDMILEVEGVKYQNIFKKKEMNIEDLDMKCIGMLMCPMMIKFFQKGIAEGDRIYMNFIDFYNETRQMTYMISKSNNGKAGEIAMHLTKSRCPIKNMKEVLNPREMHEYEEGLKLAGNKSIEVMNVSGVRKDWNKENRQLDISGNVSSIVMQQNNSINESGNDIEFKISNNFNVSNKHKENDKTKVKAKNEAGGNDANNNVNDDEDDYYDPHDNINYDAEDDALSDEDPEVKYYKNKDNQHNIFQENNKPRLSFNPFAK